MHKKLNKILQNFVVFPVLTASFALNPVAGLSAKLPSAAAISSDQTRTLSSVLADNQQPSAGVEAAQDLDTEAAKVDAFMAQYKLPMAGEGHALVKAAVDNGLSPYEIAVIAVVESTGGKFACVNNKYNAFGWDSCHGQKFTSYQDAIDTVASTISGNNPNTAKYYVKPNGQLKDFDTRFEVYNGYANDSYVANIKWAMAKIDSMQVTPPITLASL